MQPDSLHLLAIEGPHLDDSPFVVAPRQAATVGRAHDCHICLADPTVSRHHCSFGYRGGRWFICDLESRHGTILNAVRLDARVSHPLASRDLLRLGPWTLRVSIAGREDLASVTVASTVEETPNHRVFPVEASELAQHRLHLLLDAFSRINAARTEPELSEAVVDSALSATQFERAAVLRQIDGPDALAVLHARSRDNKEEDRTPDAFQYSRSLLREAEKGQVVRLSSDREVPFGVSIAQLGITDALCAPIMFGGVVVAYLYLDARGQKMPIQADAADFCEAIARLCGLSLANLKREELENRHRSLESELAAAREAQQLIVPPAQRELNGIRYAMRMDPGSFVAGDLFDIVPIHDGRTAVVIGDVTGEGIGAAILMASAQSHLHSALRMFPDPGIALTQANAYIADRSAANKFISMWVGIFNRETGEILHVDAGHSHWMVRRLTGEVEPSPLPNGTLVGIDSSFSYASRSMHLEPGDRIILYSDGVLEEVNQHGEQFGSKRIAKVIEKTGSVQEDVDQIFAAVREHGGTPELADDATVASVTFLGIGLRDDETH